MTKENELHRGDLWFNPNEPEKLAVFKKNKWETIPDNQKEYPSPQLSDKQKDII